MDPLFSSLMSRELKRAPPEVLNSFSGRTITLLDFEDRRRLLTDESLRRENGVNEFLDGSMIVAASCFIPGVTKEMARWWLWWFPQDSDRFRVWYPGNNGFIEHDGTDPDYFSGDDVPEFRPHTLVPKQDIGRYKAMYRLDLRDPHEFGLDPGDSEDAPFVVCGSMMVRTGKRKYTDFAYVFFPEEGGIRMTTRFWMGREMGNKFIRISMVNERRAKALGVSCYEEYVNLADVLPELYETYGPKK